MRNLSKDQNPPEPELPPKIVIEWDSKVTKVKFNGHEFFKNMVFEGIGNLNVITGPGKSNF